MAIDLVCYSSLPPDDVKGVLDLMSSQHRGLFAERFLISWVKDLRDTDDYYDSVAVEIALEHGMHASCSFRVGLNDKSAANLLPTVEAIIKNALGDSNVLILFNNEERR
jgi:hypothetical protein